MTAARRKCKPAGQVVGPPPLFLQRPRQFFRNQVSGEKAMKGTTKEFATVLQFETLAGVQLDGFHTGVLYCVPNQPGLWRRVPRLSNSLKKRRPGAVLGYIDGAIIELVRDPAAEKELAEAGF